MAQLGKRFHNAANAFHEPVSSEYRLRTLTLTDVKNYFLEVSARYARVSGGGVYLKRADKDFIVQLMALDDHDDPVEISSGRYLGKIYRTKNLDGTFLEFMGSDEIKISHLKEGF